MTKSNKNILTTLFKSKFINFLFIFFISGIISVFLLNNAPVLQAYAESEQNKGELNNSTNEDGTTRISGHIRGSLLWKIKDGDATDLQDLLDTSFCALSLNGTNQNYILSIIQDPNLDVDLSKYIKALSDALNENATKDGGIAPTSFQKSISVLKILCDHEGCSFYDYVNQDTLDFALNHTIGEKGIMSYIYGLYMLDNLKESPTDITYEEVLNTLISMQCQDGGYTLAGDTGDNDVTAMALQALAPSYLKALASGTDEHLISSVESSIKFLSNGQLSSGDCQSFGTPCPESTAQVILALYALGRSPLTDEDFIKEGNTLIDGLLLYSKEDGGFSHTLKTPSNDMATSQSLQALMCVYTPDADSSVALSAENISEESISTDSTGKDNIDKKNADSSSVALYKILIPAMISIICLGVGIVLTVRRKKVIHLISGIVLAAALIGLFFGLDIRSKSSYENETSSVILSENDDEAITISFLISAATVSKDDIYPVSTLHVKKDSTVFEVLSEVCRLEKIQLDYEKNSVYGLAYIKGINSIYEHDHGDLSGWMYRVNGVMPGIGCGYYNLSDGDKVEILYSTNIGRDLDD